MYRLKDFDFDLPLELIAQTPAEKRDESKLLVVHRANEEFEICSFKDLPKRLSPQMSLVCNNTKVFPARLFGEKSTGSRVEILLTKQVALDCWEVLARPGKKLKMATRITFSPRLSAQVIEDFSDRKILKFHCSRDLMEELDEIGQIPLPPYIKREQPRLKDKEQYQTVYAKERGSIAAPTAGLHFTPEIFEALEKKGIQKHELTLHVGLGTFHPIVHENLNEHTMHEETYWISEALKKHLEETDPSQVICVGTTTLRALESATDDQGKIHAGQGQTRLFIQPGYSFKSVRHLLTNFHLPKSSLFILICAFMGLDLAKKAYHFAIENRLRFFSYGDAMLIL